jgi:NlpC/P60 family putative phage cell wall peptidase
MNEPLASIRSAILEEAKTWLGTPYHHKSAQKGVGVDCLGLIHAVYSALNLVPAIAIPEYSPNWFLHQDKERFLEGLAPYATEIAQAKSGDLILWRFGRSFSHAGILVEENLVIHALRGFGCLQSELSDAPLVGRPMRKFTFLKKAF